MSGILRNLFTIIKAFFSYGTSGTRSRVSSWFWISPFDTGFATLKSDKYFQLAESAQFDFVIKTKLFWTMLKHGYQFVNGSQLVKFMKPIGIFNRVRVATEIIYADEKWVYFSHSFYVREIKHGEVLVKMKFKNGPRTVSPGTLLGHVGKNKPHYVQCWDDTLEAV